MAESNRKQRISRRSFARSAAFAATAVAVPAKMAQASPDKEMQPTAQTPTADLDCRFQALLQKYGDRLSEDEKSDIKRLLAQGQKTADALRGFPLANSDEPATVFQVYRPQVNARETTPRSTRRRAR